MAKPLDDSYNPPPSGKKLTWDMFANKYKWKKGYNTFRLYGLVYSDARHDNIPTRSGKAYNEYCRGYDVDNDVFFDNRRELCTCCSLDMPHKIRRFVNVLSVDMWEQRPANIDPNVWNPFFLLELSPNLHDTIMNLKQHRLNPTRANVGDTLKGSMISVDYNPDAASPALTYTGVSIVQAGWKFDEAMLAYSFFQTDPNGKRHARAAEGGMPAAWVYYPCRSPKDEMDRSLRYHGHLGGAPSAASETNAGVKAKGDKLMGELSSLVKEGEPAIPSGGVAQLAKLREEGAAQVAPPPAAKPQAQIVPDSVSEEEIPF